MAREQLTDKSDELRIVQVAHRQIHADGDVEPAVPPRATLPNGGAQHPVRQLLDQPGLFGKRDELIRRNQPALRMFPAHQRLDPLAAPCAQVDFGLVVQNQLVVLDRRAQLADQRQSFGIVPILLPRIDRMAAPAPLCDVHRHVCMAQECFGVCAVLDVHRYADAGAD